MTTEPDSVDPVDPAAVHQPALEGLELPDYHGRQPVGMRTSLTGAGNRIARAHGIGDRVVLVIEAKVKRAGHEDTDDGLLYTETHKVVDLFEIDRDPGARLLAHLRSSYRTERDAAEGKAPLPDLGDVGWTDANGVALTPKEYAERRGDPVALLGAEQMTPAVIVYDDGSRALWPDEYERDFPRPRSGDEHAAGRVVELIHHATGETIEEDLHDDDLDAEPDPEETERMVDDDAPAYDDADDYADVVPFEKPDRKNAPPALPGEEELAQRLPTSADFAFVDRSIPELRTAVAEVADLILLRRFLEAEKQGRGRGLLARKGATDAILARIAAVEEAGK